MGLTFQQKFYQVPEQVFLVICPNGSPKAILEMPENDDEVLKLKKKLSFGGNKVVVLNFDTLITNGYNLFRK